MICILCYKVFYLKKNFLLFFWWVLFAPTRSSVTNLHIFLINCIWFFLMFFNVKQGGFVISDLFKAGMDWHWHWFGTFAKQSTMYVNQPILGDTRLWYNMVLILLNVHYKRFFSPYAESLFFFKIKKLFKLPVSRVWKIKIK